MVVAHLQKRRGRRHSTLFRSKNMERKRSIRFSEVVEIVPQNHSYSIDDIREMCWYNKWDFHRFKDECIQTVQAIATSNDLSSMNSEKFCTRGLDLLIYCEFDMLQKRKRTALVRMVLIRQRYLRIAGCSNPELLRVISERMSKESKDIAMKLGRLDFISILE